MQSDPVLTDPQYRSLSNQLIHAVRDRFQIIPINTLKHDRYFLKKPVFITIEVEKDTVIASLDDIEAFAYAETEYEAINQLCEELVCLFEDLSEDKENLGILPHQWLAYLEEVIGIK